MEDDKLVTREELKGIVKLVLNFLESENISHLDYIEENGKTFAFSLDPAYKYFLEIIPKEPEEGRMSTAIRCVYGDTVTKEARGDSYEELRDALLYAILDDSKLGSLMVVRCEDRLRKYSYVFRDRYGNLIQSRALGTGMFSKLMGEMSSETIRTQKLKRELRYLSRTL